MSANPSPKRGIAMNDVVRGRLLPAMLAVLSAACGPALAQDVGGYLDGYRPRMNKTAQALWDYAEVGYKEVRSAKLLEDELRQQGFKVETGVAGIPTAFVARYSARGGGPVIAMLAEYDALPGLSQQAVPSKQPRAGVAAGHGCGHNLFGAGSVGAAIAIKQWLQQTGTAGEIRVYGSPAEEGGSGKVYMVREGLYKDVDLALHWHPSDRNSASIGTSLANISAKFNFHGLAAHAAGAPERGRSALDAVEAMDNMVNMMREHIPSGTRIHYIITSGGSAPNVVPDYAQAYYYVRDKDPEVVRSVFERVKLAAQGAALGTGTKYDVEITGGVYNLLPNETLGRAMYDELASTQGISWSAADVQFADALRKSIGIDAAKFPAPTAVEPFGEDKVTGGSTDVSDVSWVVPTAGLGTATWVPGTPGHSWASAATSGTGIGDQGMYLAALVLAKTAVKLYTTPKLVTDAKAEFERRRGPDFVYKPMLGDRKPALNYRD